MQASPGRRARVHAPGKLFLAGEYAVVTPGEPAVLAAVDAGVTVTVVARTTSRSIRSDGYGETEWEPAPAGVRARTTDHRLDYVLAAQSVVERLREEREMPSQAYDIDIVSDLWDRGGAKFGLGSSGAVTVGVVRAVSDLLQLSLSNEEVYRLAMLATVTVAPDASGGDLAASAFGGWVFYRSPDRACLVDELAHGASVTQALSSAAWAGCEVSSLPAPGDLSFIVGWTGQPASTASLVSAVKAALAQEPSEGDAFLEASRRAVSQLRAGLDAGDATRTLSALRAARAAIRALGVSTGVDIETAPVRAMCEIIESYGGVAKSSGAGGGDCAIALIPPHLARATVDDALRAAGITPLAISVTDEEGGGSEFRAQR